MRLAFLLKANYLEKDYDKERASLLVCGPSLITYKFSCK